MTMNRLTILTGALFLFGTGFLAGHYGATGNTPGIDKTKIEESDTISQTSTPKPIQNSLPKSDHSDRTVRFPSNSKPGTDCGSVQQTPSRTPLHALALPKEKRAQPVAKLWEVKQANISQMEEMIQTLEEGGAPSENIKHLLELKKSIEEQPIDEPQAPEANPPALTEDELMNDFDASLEQASIPAAVRDKMREASLPLPESIHDNP